MVSGQGVFTKKGRCYPVFVEYINCYNNHIYPGDHCKAQLEDYFECLHHRKEKARLIAIIKELEAQQEEHAKLSATSRS